MTMGFLILTVIAATAIYGHCFAAQIGYGEEPRLDLDILPRELHRKYAFPPPFLFKEYPRPINSLEKETNLSKTPESPSIEPSDIQHHSTEENSCEHSESSLERQKPAKKLYYKHPPIHITYTQLRFPEDIHRKHSNALMSKQSGGDTSLPLAMPVLELLFNKPPQSPQIYSSGSASPENKPSSPAERSDKQQPIFGDSSSEETSLQEDISSQPRTSHHLHQSFYKRQDRQSPMPLYEFLFHSLPVNRSDKAQSPPEDLSHEDLEPAPINPPAKRVPIQKELGSKNPDSDEVITESTESSRINRLDTYLSPSGKLLRRSESKPILISDRTDSQRIPPIDSSDMKHFLPKIWYQNSPIDPSGTKQSVAEKETSSVRPSGPGFPADNEESKDQQALDNETLEPVDTKPSHGAPSRVNLQRTAEKRQKRNSKCDECKPFKTNHWQDPPI